MERRQRPESSDVDLRHDIRHRNRLGALRGWCRPDTSELEVDLLGECTRVVHKITGLDADAYLRVHA